MLERPVLLPGLDFYLNAYQELQHDRQIGMAAGTIPWSSIVRWAEFHGITDPDEVATLEHHIRAMERAVSEFEEKNKPKNNPR